ncbi:hypothetical protein DEO72_LG5g2182 [Vigna unguiculata]|uniref:Uncharacterized protein n=2 Tax=Vigna unguiculata TaxID=3917 RepID=A0A4D6M031_VIGUN|nr:hypothetical protein DEO72_LG5g2182 [Vigna unguiculata]
MEKDEEEEDADIKFSKRVMILISKSNQGSIPKSSVIDAERESSKEFGPIWFFLIGAEENKGIVPLSQLSSCFLRLKDGSVTVSFIKRHTVRRSCSETEVEIRLQGRPVLSSWKLNSLVEMWVQTLPKNETLVV